MKNKMPNVKIIGLGMIALGITSGVVLAQNDLSGDNIQESVQENIQDSMQESNQGNIEQQDIGDIASGIESFSTENDLEDVEISKESNVPSEVGIDAKKENIKNDRFPTIPGFKKESNGIIGQVPNENRTMIQLIDTGEEYELRTSSEILYDKILQSYVKQIVDYYKGKKYTSEISGVHAILRIEK